MRTQFHRFVLNLDRRVAQWDEDKNNVEEMRHWAPALKFFERAPLPPTARGKAAVRHARNRLDFYV